MQPTQKPLFDTVVDNAKNIIADDLSNAECTPIPYLDRQRSEQAVMDCIQLGNINLLNKLLQSDLDSRTEPHVGTLSKNSTKQLQYLGIVAVTLASRGAISGGVPEGIALALSDSYIQQIEQISQVDQLEFFYKDVFRGFCQIVHNHDTKCLSLPVRQCYDYMLVHLYSKLTLDELSRVCHLSPNYISDLFRKELKMGAIQYFHHQKIKLAAYFLLNTNSTVAEISALLSYSSQSKFTQRFKETYGATPTKYRTAHKQKRIA